MTSTKRPSEKSLGRFVMDIAVETRRGNSTSDVEFAATNGEGEDHGTDRQHPEPVALRESLCSTKSSTNLRHITTPLSLLGVCLTPQGYEETGPKSDSLAEL